MLLKSKIFDAVGNFDDNLPACEDYDLWLRIASNHLIGLIEQPYIIKRGGHPDQLSRTVWGLDRFRISSLVKLLKNGTLNDTQRQEAIQMLQQKCAIYSQGCIKRGKREEAEFIAGLPENFT